MMVKKILGILLILLVFPSMAYALPGQSFTQVETWLQHHPFFPSAGLPADIQLGHHKVYRSHAFDHLYCVVAARQLNQDRILVFESCYDWRPFKETSEPIGPEKEVLVEFERISLLRHSQCPQLQFDFDILNENRETGGHEKDLTNCLQNIGVDFKRTKSETVQKILHLVYGERAFNISDLENSNPCYQGQRYFYYSSDKTHRYEIPNGPILQVIYRGKDYDYLTTSHSLMLAKKKTWEQVMAGWEIDAQLLKTNYGREQQPTDSDKMIPYEL